MNRNIKPIIDIKKVLNEAEANHYQLQFDLKSNSIKQIWYNLNSVTSLSKKNKVSIPKLLMVQI